MNHYIIRTTIEPIPAGTHEAMNFLIETSKEVNADFLRIEAEETLRQLNKTGANRAIQFGEPIEIQGEINLPNFAPIRVGPDIKTWIVDWPDELKPLTKS